MWSILAPETGSQQVYRSRQFTGAGLTSRVDCGELP